MRRSTRTEAFTLVELVVAAAVAVVAMAVAAAALLGGHSLAARIASGAPAFDDVLAREAAFESLRADLACAIPSAGSPLEGARDSFRCLRLLPAPDGAFEIAAVEWGRAPHGGAVRRVLSTDGAVLREDVHPASWGTPAFGYRGIVPRDGTPFFSLAEAVDSWPPPGAPAGRPPLPAVVEVRWDGRSFSLPVPCAAPEETEGDG